MYQSERDALTDESGTSKGYPKNQYSNNGGYMTSRYTLNIGLANPFTGEDNTIPETLTKAFEYVSDVTNVAVKQSGTEQTVIIDFNEVYGSMTVLATALDQDCIALFDNETGEGNLFGDKRDKWLPFNPECFLTI